MTREKMVKLVRGGLLAFVCVTIGFALGKESARREFARRPTDAGPKTSEGAREAEEPGRVIVYYAHTTFRCVTCNRIEELAKKVIDTRFAQELAAGTVEWRTENFQDNEEFASSHEIVSSCIVVVPTKGDRGTDYRRLDEVWTLVKDPPAFEKYVVNAVREFLPDAKEDD